MWVGKKRRSRVIHPLSFVLCLALSSHLHISRRSLPFARSDFLLDLRFVGRQCKPFGSSARSARSNLPTFLWVYDQCKLMPSDSAFALASVGQWVFEVRPIVRLGGFGFLSILEDSTCLSACIQLYGFKGYCKQDHLKCSGIRTGWSSKRPGSPRRARFSRS